MIACIYIYMYWSIFCDTHIYVLKNLRSTSLGLLVAASPITAYGFGWCLLGWWHCDGLCSGTSWGLLPIVVVLRSRELMMAGKHIEDNLVTGRNKIIEWELEWISHFVVRNKVWYTLRVLCIIFEATTYRYSSFQGRFEFRWRYFSDRRS